MSPLRRTRVLPRALAFLGFVLVGGCPGTIEDPAFFDSHPTCPTGIDVPQLLATRCGSAVCHGGGGSGMPQAGLDLTAPDLVSGLVGVEAEECPGHLRIDPDHPDQSFLLSKIEGPPASCGDRMPIVGYLTRDEILCIRAFVFEAAARTRADGGTDASVDAAVDGGP